MLDENQIAAASRTLHHHWRAGTKLAALESSQRPRDRAEGYAIQAALAAYSTGRLFGWKIAATSEAGQKHIGNHGLAQDAPGHRAVDIDVAARRP
jgi:2-keto-4-pentenoate hydratase